MVEIALHRLHSGARVLHHVSAALLIPILRIHSSGLWERTAPFQPDPLRGRRSQCLSVSFFTSKRSSSCIRAIGVKTAPDIIAAIVLCGSGVLLTPSAPWISVLFFSSAEPRSDDSGSIDVAAWLGSPMLPPSLIDLISSGSVGPQLLSFGRARGLRSRSSPCSSRFGCWRAGTSRRWSSSLFLCVLDVPHPLSRFCST